MGGRRECHRGACGSAENLSQNDIIRTRAMVSSLGQKLTGGNSPEPRSPKSQGPVISSGDWKLQRMPCGDKHKTRNYLRVKEGSSRPHPSPSPQLGTATSSRPTYLALPCSKSCQKGSDLDHQDHKCLSARKSLVVPTMWNVKEPAKGQGELFYLKTSYQKQCEQGLQHRLPDQMHLSI